MADSAGEASESTTGMRPQAVVTGPNCGVGRSSRRSSPCSPFHRLFKHRRNRMHTVRIEMLDERIYYHCACAVLRSSLTNVRSGQCREQRRKYSATHDAQRAREHPRSASVLDV